VEVFYNKRKKKSLLCWIVIINKSLKVNNVHSCTCDYSVPYQENALNAFIFSLGSEMMHNQNNKKNNAIVTAAAAAAIAFLTHGSSSAVSIIAVVDTSSKRLSIRKGLNFF
jgi:serine protease inhibitor